MQAQPSQPTPSTWQCGHCPTLRCQPQDVPVDCGAGRGPGRLQVAGGTEGRTALWSEGTPQSPDPASSVMRRRPRRLDADARVWAGETHCGSRGFSCFCPVSKCGFDGENSGHCSPQAASPLVSVAPVPWGWGWPCYREGLLSRFPNRRGLSGGAHGNTCAARGTRGPGLAQPRPVPSGSWRSGTASTAT